jgi:Flp pilus assembly protein TadG
MMIHALKTFNNDTRGLAMIEGAMILPFMIILLFGLFDIGQAMVINQKLKAATYTASDLITRKSYINDADIDNAIGGAFLVIDPYNRNQLGIDIAGIEFDENDSPDVIWRNTTNMTPDTDIPSGADGLGSDGEGLVIVSTGYNYSPLFSSLFTGDITMRETSFMRGRRTSVVRYSN